MIESHFCLFVLYLIQIDTLIFELLHLTGPMCIQVLVFVRLTDLNTFHQNVLSIENAAKKLEISALYFLLFMISIPLHEPGLLLAYFQ